MDSVINIFIKGADKGKLGRVLDHSKVPYFQAKSIGDVGALIVQLGGGAGIGAIIIALGTALKSYFDGVAAVETAKRVEIVGEGFSIRVDPDKVNEAMVALKDILEKNVGATDGAHSQ